MGTKLEDALLNLWRLDFKSYIFSVKYFNSQIKCSSVFLSASIAEKLFWVMNKFSLIKSNLYHVSTCSLIIEPVIEIKM